MAAPGAEIAIDWQGELALVRLERPEKLNALTTAMLDGLEATADALDAGQGRGMIVTGAGARAFCAGTDLGESASLGAEGSAAKTLRARALLVRIHRAPWTSVAALNGLAYGGGLELAMACTFRVAAPGVRLSLPEIKLGVLPAYAGTQLLPALVGRARALDLMLTGRAIDAEEALAWGLVDRVAADADALLDDARALAEQVLGYSQFVIERVRRCVAAAGDGVSNEGLAVEAAAVDEVLGSEDAREGTVAFLQKRKPKFVHR